MRLVHALAFAALLTTGPAFAQDAAPAAPADAQPAAPADTASAAPAAPVLPPPIEEVGPTADRDFWCALAFSLTARSAQIGGDMQTQQQESAKSQIMFAGIVTAMKAKNFLEEQFNALTAQYTVRAMDPFGEGGKRYTRQECDTAVSEAEAAVSAAQPDAAAPATEAPATETPAAPATP